MSMFELFLAVWILLVFVVVLYIFELKKHSKESESSKVNEHNYISSLKDRDKAFKTTALLNEIILETLDFNQAAQKIANAIPLVLGYETGVLALVDENKQILKRVTISETSGGSAALKALEVPFLDISIGLREEENLCIKALKENKQIHTVKLWDVLRPVISYENAEKVQKLMGTKTTLICPIYTKDNKSFGTFLVSMHKDYDQISEYEHQTINNFVDAIRIVLQNATLYTSLSQKTADLKVANEHLKELDRMKDDFVSVASHELRTPMTAIKSYLWMALAGQGGALNEKQTKYIQRAYLSTDRLIKLVNDMLNISRIDSGRLTVQIEPVNIVHLIREVMEELNPRSSELGIQIELVQNDNISDVLADPDKIKEVFYNLVGNSMKFTAKDGKITITCFQKEAMVEISVSDTGVGIEPDDLPKIFQKFNILPGTYVTNQATFGTGLGLYICKSLIELHGGKIWVKSDGKGRGATFSFTLKVFNNEDYVKFQEKFKKTNS